MITPTENIGLTFYKALVSSAGAPYTQSKVFLVGGYVPANTPQYNLYLQAIKATGSDNPGGQPIPPAVAQAVGALYDGGIILALAMDMAHSTKGSVYDSYVPKVTNASPEPSSFTPMRPELRRSRRESTSTTLEWTARPGSTGTTSPLTASGSTG